MYPVNVVGLPQELAISWVSGHPTKRVERGKQGGCAVRSGSRD